MTSNHPLLHGNPPPWASAWGRDRFGVWASFTVGDVTQRMRWIPHGEFVMGAPEGEGDQPRDETPHRVRLTCGYWLGETPVTQALWATVMATQPSRFEGAERPVENVSWEDVQALLAKLRESGEGFEVRLPSEAQWEFACRAGTTGPTYAEDLDSIAWYGANSAGMTHPVGEKEPNAFGLHDILGNVWEWCQDWVGDYPREHLEEDPTGPVEGWHRVRRGGSWGYVARFVRAACRDAGRPVYRNNGVGFRLAAITESRARTRAERG